MTNHTNVVYAENKTELPWLTRSGVECDENQIEQRHEWSYMCSLGRKQNLAILTDRIECGMWWKSNRKTSLPIVQIRFMTKMILNYHDRLNQVSIIMKTKKDNDMIDSTDMVNAKNKIELSWPIGLGTVFDKNKIGEREIGRASCRERV